MSWTDSAGTRSVSMSTADNSGRYCLRDLSSVTYNSKLASGTVDLEVHAFITDLVAKMDAQTANTVTGSFNTSTLAHTIACTGGTFSFTFSGGAGDVMRRILGFTGNKSGQTTYTSDMRPWFVWRAAIDGRTNYQQPAMVDDQLSQRFAGSQGYAIGPTRPVREARWEHHHEAKEDVHRKFADADTLASGASWTFEDWAETAALYGGPIIAESSTETQVGWATHGFGRASFDRSRKDYDGNQTVRVAMRVEGYL